MHQHLPRLDQVWLESPIIYITTCSLNRRPILANDEFHKICCEVWQNAEQLYGWIVGRYVIMPDHVHFFCCAKIELQTLAIFVGKWKEWTSKYAKQRLNYSTPLWQSEFFDHILRSSESYEEKWLYVRDNPIRAGLATAAGEWPYQGELNKLRW